jgi:hypothetical protein
MSILAVHTLPQGIIFGADRNITHTKTSTDENNKHINIVVGQTQSPKVLRWPNYKAIIGYVGQAVISGIPTHEWLYNFIGRHIEFNNLAYLAEELNKEVYNQRIIDEGDTDPQILIIHLAGFEKENGNYVPLIYYIRNSYQLTKNGYSDIRKEFQCSEEFWKYFPEVPKDKIKDNLDYWSKNKGPFWFHQGADLGTFNILDIFIKSAFNIIFQNNVNLSFPRTLEEWEKHMKMIILTYEAYYQSFMGPGEQIVGGGVDIVSLPWPD